MSQQDSPAAQNGRKRRARQPDKENGAVAGLVLAGAACVGASLAHQFKLWQSKNTLQGKEATAEA